MANSLVIFATIVTLLVVEGLGLKDGQKIVLFMITILPLVYFLLNQITTPNKKTTLPRQLGMALGVFIAFSLISIFYAGNIQTAFEYFLFYCAAAIIFIYSYQNDHLLKPIHAALGLSIMIFALFILNLHLRIFSSLGYPDTGYNFYYATYENHNHLGDLSVLLYTGLLYKTLHYKNSRALWYVLIFFTVCAMLFLGTRTSLLTTVLITFGLLTRNKWKEWEKLWNKKIVALGVILTLFGIFTYYLFSNFFNSLLNGRDNLFHQAYLSVLDNPLWGVGPGNFILSSVKYTWEPFTWSFTATNIFVDMVTENGIPAVCAFILFLYFCFKKMKFTTLGEWLCFALIIMFQTDYLYRFYSIFIIFFMLLGATTRQNSDEKTMITLPWWVILGASVGIFISGQLMLVSNLLVQQQHYETAVKVYPLNLDAYEAILPQYKEGTDYKNGLPYLKKYARIFNKSPYQLKQTGDYYNSISDPPMALIYYQKAYINNPFGGDLYKTLFTMTQQLYGKNKAKEFLQAYFKKVQNVPNRYSSKDFLYEDIKKFCTIQSCPSYSDIF